MKTTAMITGLGTLVGLPAAAQEIFFYPAQGQSPEQQEKDQGECHAWAVQQTAFDPAHPPAAPAAAPAAEPQGGLLRGGARGAAVGGAIAGDAGKGAAIGAATGALLGGMRRRDQQQAQAQQTDAAQQQYQAQLAQDQETFGRALTACMEGRGYSAS